MIQFDPLDLSRFRTVATLAFFIGMVGSAAAADKPAVKAASSDAERNWTIEFNQDFRFLQWSGTRGFPVANRTDGNFRGRGSEFYAPFGLQLSGLANDLKVEALFRSGFVHSQQRTFGLSGRQSEMTDSVVTTTLTYQGIAGFQPFFALNLNLPTGQRILGARASTAQMDSDIVEVPSFGEGFNIGPTLGLNLPINSNWLISTSVGYTHRSPFVRGSVSDGVVSVTRSQPGGETAGNASINYTGDKFTAGAALSVAFPESDRIDGVFSIRGGARFNIALDAGYTWTDSWNTKAQLAINHTRRNKILDNATLAIALEPFNSNSTRYNASLTHTYSWDKFSLGAIAGVLYRDHNAFQPVDLQFVSAKLKLSAGAQFEYKPTSDVTLSVKLERFWLSEASHPDKIFAGAIVPDLAIPRLHHRGWSGGLSGSIKF